MISWEDQGLLLSVRRHGETSAIIDVLTENHGLHAGLVRGGGSAKMVPVLQPGAQLMLSWKARLSEHLGHYSIEPLRSRAGALLADRGRLAALNSMASLILAFVPERAPDKTLYEMTVTLADSLATDQEDWRSHYAIWELGLLAALGFRLDLESCAATRTTQDLIWVSPKSGRAVSRTGGKGWEDRLLALPALFRGQPPQPDDVVVGLRLTGYFLANWALAQSQHRNLPEARERLIVLLSR